MNEQNFYDRSGWYVSYTTDTDEVGHEWAAENTEASAKQLRRNVIRRKGIVSAEVGYEAETLLVDADEDLSVETLQAEFDAEQAAIDEGFIDYTTEDEGAAAEYGDEPEEVAIDEDETIEPSTEGATGWMSFRAVAEMLGCRYQQVWQRMNQNRLDAEHVGPRGVWAAKWEGEKSVTSWMTARNQYFTWREAKLGQTTVEVDGKTVIVTEDEAESME